MVDLLDLKILLPSYRNNYIILIQDLLKIKHIVEIILGYIASLTMSYDIRNREITLSTPITFTLTNYALGLNCNSINVKCIYPHHEDLFCYRFNNTLESNDKEYIKGLNLLLHLINLYYPKLGVRQFKDRVDVLTREPPSPIIGFQVKSRTIYCFTIHISGSYIHCNWIDY